MGGRLTTCVEFDAVRIGRLFTEALSDLLTRLGREDLVDAATAEILRNGRDHIATKGCTAIEATIFRFAQESVLQRNCNGDTGALGGVVEVEARLAAAGEGFVGLAQELFHGLRGHEEVKRLSARKIDGAMMIKHMPALGFVVNDPEVALNFRREHLAVVIRPPTPVDFADMLDFAVDSDVGSRGYGLSVSKARA